MSGILFLLFIVVPIVEIYVFVAVADAIGVLPALAWIVLVSAAGAWLVKREGLSALARASERINAGEVPTKEIASGILILFGGALMLTPGFLTDVLGLTLLFPPTRALLARPVQRRLRSSSRVAGFGSGPGVRFTTFTTSGAGTGFGGFGDQRSGDDVIDADSWEADPTNRRDTPPEIGPDGTY